MFAKKWCWMRPALLLAACLVLSVTPSAAQAQGDSNQVALITLASYEEIIGDIGFVGQLIGRPEIAQQAEGMTMFLAGGLNGLDKAKAIGVAVYADGNDLSVVGMVPVSDLQTLLDGLGALQLQYEEGADGVTEISASGQTLYAKVQGGWAIVAQQKDHLSSAPADPDGTVNALAGEYDIAAKIFVQNIPADLRALAINGLQQGMEQGLERDADESDEQYKLRQQLMTANIEQFEQILEEMDELTIGWSIDSKEERTFLDFVFTAVPDTNLAKQIAAYGDTKTNYAGFYQPDAAVMMVLASEMAQEEVDQAMGMMDGVRAQILKAIDEESDLPDDAARDVVKGAVGDFFDAFVATLKEGKMDGGAVLNLAPDALTVVAGGFCADPDKVKSGLKKLEALAEQEPDFPGISWDAESHRGVSFHTISAPIQGNEEEAKALFGDNVDIVIGTGADSIYFAVGRDALDACKGVIDASYENPEKSISPFELSISASQVMSTIAALDNDANVKQIAESLESEADGRDHLRVTVNTIDNGVKYHIEIEEGVLRAIGKAAELWQNDDF